MELPLPRAGYADLLGVTPEGEVVLAEVKLGRNVEARREIVAQALEYHAALRRLSFEGLEAACLRARRTPLTHGGMLYEISGAAEAGIGREDFRERVAHRLRTGSVLLLLVLDRAPDELVRLVADAISDQPALPFDVGLLEVGIHNVPGAGVVLTPRLRGTVLTRTRAVVRIEGSLAVAAASAEDDRESASAPRAARTLAGFLADLDATHSGLGRRFKAFLEKSMDLGVHAEVAHSVVMRLGEVNLGSADVYARLEVYLTNPAREAGRDAFVAYLHAVATLSGGTVKAESGTGDPRLYVPLAAVLEGEAAWFAAIRAYRDAVEAGAFLAGPTA